MRALLAFAVIAASLFITLFTSPRLGLDLRGGTQIVLQTHDSPYAKADRRSTDRAVEVLRRRIDALGVSEPALTRSGDKRIIVELPGVQDARQATGVIGRTAQLSFHSVVPTGGRAMPDEKGQPLQVGPVALTGKDVGTAQAGFDPQSLRGWFVSVDFHHDAAWQRLTAKAACAAPGDPARRVAILLDDRVISAPQVDPGVGCGTGITGGSTQITGDFGEKDAKNLAALIQGGALPVPVDVVEQRTVGPTLGAEAIDASARAAVIGVVLTALFVIWMYRLAGVVAALALGSYALISYAALSAMGATLTLPGLAGFVLAIGMAVDANVLVFERAREEHAAMPRQGVRSALTRGFRKAWSAIADSNMTTLLAAGLLFFLASGSVRGFGITLSIGVLASFVSALLVTRVLAEWALGRRAVAARPSLTGLAGSGRVRRWIERRDPDVMGRRRIWLSVSAVAVLLAVTGIAVRGLNLGVEFTGGRLVEYSTSRSVDADTARRAVSNAGFPHAVVQASGGNDVSVRTGDLTDDQEHRIHEALQRHGGTVTKQRDERVGPSLGSELRDKAVIALGAALGGQLVYLAIRFRWTFGAGAVLAMLHDVVIVTGLFAWSGRSVDGVFLAALLTIIGYSVNDSVVVFDRVRELWREDPKAPLAGIANRAALQTVPRTVNTGMGAIFILAALALLGGDSLTDFAVALLAGILVGTWSSVFTATPITLALEGRRPAGTPRPEPYEV
ncbi:protein translocase subunit SecD [Actinoallomurus purpureus]|uniref:protein translocase subunit SecD n=1 Tax=Actinoallomurus purpureus TaxID=478114 RepID=UPI0020924616|nr:protein translocase subunit SecD [Actinoallomurus purpureus]MCO6006289.1 protein translocase subunit SecD [Actinoallomurus purpureus]